MTPEVKNSSSDAIAATEEAVRLSDSLLKAMHARDLATRDGQNLSQHEEELQKLYQQCRDEVEQVINAPAISKAMALQGLRVLASLNALFFARPKPIELAVLPQENTGKRNLVGWALELVTSLKNMKFNCHQDLFIVQSRTEALPSPLAYHVLDLRADFDAVVLVSNALNSMTIIISATDKMDWKQLLADKSYAEIVAMSGVEAIRSWPDQAIWQGKLLARLNGEKKSKSRNTGNGTKHMSISEFISAYLQTTESLSRYSTGEYERRLGVKLANIRSAFDYEMRLRKNPNNFRKDRARLSKDEARALLEAGIALEKRSEKPGDYYPAAETLSRLDELYTVKS